MAAASPGQPSPIVGLRREREVLAVALETGRHVVIEGPPGTGKSTLLRDIARQVVDLIIRLRLDPTAGAAPFVLPVDAAQRIRTGERGSDAI